MQIGNLDRRIKVQSFTVVSDTNGQELPVWSDHATVWARADYESSRESEEGDELVAVSVVKFFIRYLSTITEVMRIKWDGQYYRVLSIEEVGIKHWMVVRAEWKDSRWFDILRSTGDGLREIGDDDLRSVGYKGAAV